MASIENYSLFLVPLLAMVLGYHKSLDAVNFSSVNGAKPRLTDRCSVSQGSVPFFQYLNNHLVRKREETTVENPIVTSQHTTFKVATETPPTNRSSEKPQKNGTTSITKNIPPTPARESTNNSIQIGRASLTKSFSYIVSLLRDNLRICLGTLVSESKVVTAGHCVRTQTFMNGKSLAIDPAKLFLLTELTEPTGISSEIQTLVALKIFIHPKHVDRGKAKLFDYSLVITKEPFTLQNGVPELIRNWLVNTALLDEIIFENRSCTVYGWAVPTDSKDIKASLNSVSLNIIANERCSVWLTNLVDNRGVSFRNIIKLDKSSAICSVGFKGIDFCGTSAGGPLICQDHLVGIASMQPVCGTLLSPGIFARMDVGSKWLGSVDVNGAFEPLNGDRLVRTISILAALMSINSRA